MAKPNEENTDGLEIISIGTLYNGPWDKKYWSSSRGKDRYAYPVGYQAVRTHNGITYKMEIHEGLKGPLFVITSTDGQSCSGQTPDIAWESFQKKGCPRIKLWHGKRFSCKIDGVEFFGFKNSFVQRLLRELVANVDGTTGLEFLQWGFWNKASQSTHRIILRPQGMHNADASNSGQGGKAASANLEAVVRGENNPLLAEDGLPLESFHCSDHLKVLCQAGINAVSSKSCMATALAGNLCTDDEPLDRSKDTEIQGISLSMAMENKDEKAPIPKESQNVNDVDLCAPDSFDLLHDNTSDSAPNNHKESPCNVKGELIAEHMSDFDSVGEEIAKSMMTVLLPRALPLLKKFSRKKKANINPSGISLCDGRTQVENNGNDCCIDVVSPAEFHTESSILKRQEMEKTNLGSVFPSSEQLTPIVPDSFENDQCGYHASKQLPLFSEVPEAELDTLGQDTYKPDTDTLGLPVSVDAPVQLSISHVENSDSERICSYDVHMASIERPQKGIPISESTLGCMSPSKNIFLNSDKDMCTNSDENSVRLEIHSKEKDLKTSLVCAEGASHDNLAGMGSSVQIPHREISVVEGGAGTSNTSFTQIPNVVTPMTKYNGPLTERIICRNLRSCAPETYATTDFLLISEIQPVGSLDHSPNKRVPSVAEARLDGCPQSLHTQKITLNPDGVLHNMDLVISKNKEFVCASNEKGNLDLHPSVSCIEKSQASMLQNQGFVCASNDKDNSDLPDTSVSCIEKSQACADKELLKHQNLNNSVSWLQNQGTSSCDDSVEVKEGSNLKPHMNVELDNDLESIVEFVGCYVHPTPISSVLLSTKGNEIYICVLCGMSVDKDRTLFMYKVPVKEQSIGPVGCPSFVGHTPIDFPLSRDAFGREIALDNSGLQFTPDGQCLVLLNSIKAPYCREGKMHCPCSACALDCFEKNAVKIVQVKLGYVSVMTKLKTVDNVHCILVCEPNYLVGVEESGKLHLWIMNSTWSAQTEEYDLPTSDCMSPGIVELKRIPKCAALVVGHNGLGEFSLWDISKRILVSSFSSPSTSAFQFLPISLFEWERRGPTFIDSDGKDHINEIMAATKKSFSKQGENHVFLPLDGEDIAIWLLVSTISDFDVQNDCQSSDCKINPAGWWRLALLVNNMVILGSALDPRAAGIGASGGRGIIGTCDGLVYMWELSTGAKLGDLHYFNGAGVSCVATDDSRYGPLAVASGSQLLVYLHSQEAFFKSTEK
ncbi:hypothetical protein F0562_033005 [Nyssa sinensis]|uniref:FYR C-terminal domain-containing protein n=1 Tax=Nyssa sinensis TaxID=561372 RepID=A0A5J5ARK9_9ASTE|nr:hypothetical protein F0562_033005 [Nyssa sinensis]